LRDTLSLKKEEWAALTPPRLVAGAEWVIAEDVARKLVRPFCLNTLGGDMPGPEDAKLARLTAKVEAVEEGRARIRLTGTFEAVKRFKEENLSFRGTAMAVVIAEFDVKEKTPSSVLLVFQGTYQQGVEPETQKGRPFGAVAEWQRKRPPVPLMAQVSASVQEQKALGENDDKADGVRKALEAQYARLADAVEKRDHAAFQALRTDDFNTVDEKGRKHTAQQMSDRAKAMLARIQPPIKTTNTIQKIQVKGNDAIATVRQYF